MEEIERQYLGLDDEGQQSRGCDQMQPSKGLNHHHQQPENDAHRITMGVRRRVASFGHHFWHSLLLLLLIHITQNTVLASGNFELQILEISNPKSSLLSETCCGLPYQLRDTKITGCPPCASLFRLCLKEYQSSMPSVPGVLSGCSFGNASTQVLGGSSFVLTEPELGSVVLPFSFRWTKSFTLILQALDMYNTSYPVEDQLIEEASFSGVILPSNEWHTLDHKGKNARITYRVRVKCSANYYNTTCTTFCRPRDDRFGHYTCGLNGEKVCLAGWQGSNCEQAVCKPGCDPVHGKCDRPGECECRPGWKGPFCTDCMVYPGCKHGYCNGSAWQCICQTNWGGILCDQDLNYCGTHEPCFHGGTCENTAPDQYRCTCAEGLSGVRCEVVEHPCATQPCRNGGTCTLKDPAKYEARNKTEEEADAPAVTVIRGMRGMSSMGKPMGSVRSLEGRNALKNRTGSNLVSSGGGGSKGGLASLIEQPSAPQNEFTCACAPGWTGPTCEINIDECAGGPCEHGGTCFDLVGGFRCECPPQWTGDLCQLDVDECDSNPASPFGPCINAEACHNKPGGFQCTCLEGWGGATCAKDLDDCTGQCKNGATCIDLVNDYHCACAQGYTGRNCETDIDECANNPCRNAGECIDKVDHFTCICPVGYSGVLCEEAIDHCTPSPCLEGRCYNTPGGYYCHCPPGRSGKHCELPMAPCHNPPCNDGCTPTGSANGSSSGSEVATPCSARGKCETSTAGQHCACQIGFTGRYCEHNLNECSPNPCRNGGICVDGEGDFKCECPTGWTGTTCGEVATQCLPGQCMNGGTCMAAPGLKSQCRCSTGWGGSFCTEPVDQCQGQPCHNGGICESGPGWFRCVCAKGFSGPDCRINVNECSPQPCLGGATCQDGIGGFTCICPPGRRGLRCEILLSDPSSVCMNSTTVSPYNPLHPNIGNGPVQIELDETNCNSCICSEGKPKCTNLWCGLPNCLRPPRNSTNGCVNNEVCVPALQVSCLSPPCEPRGDCRAAEPSMRVGPPKLPAPQECWPNQAVLNEKCARITIMLEAKKIPQGISVEGVCFGLRTLLGSRLIQNVDMKVASAFIVLLCDNKSGTNDTIEVTLSTPNGEKGAPKALGEAVRLLGELLSRQGKNVYAQEHPETIILAAIVEVKFETATVAAGGNGYLVSVTCGIAFAALCVGALIALMCRHRISEQVVAASLGLSLGNDAMRHEEEKSNNLQNEENFRRYANPLKGSVTSLRGVAMELSLSPSGAPPETVGTGTLAGPSAIHHRSQPLYPSKDAGDFHEKEAENPKGGGGGGNRSSQILLYKAQNTDVRKNTMGSIESPHKDFGKRAINCQQQQQQLSSSSNNLHHHVISNSINSNLPMAVDSEVLTVHV